MISFITFPLVDHFLNFHCHIKKLKIDKHHLLFAMDEKVYSYLKSLNNSNNNANIWPAYLTYKNINANKNTKEQVHGNAEFANFVKAKYIFTIAILRWNINVIYSDVDLAILRDVFEILEDRKKPIYNKNDILFLSDSHINEHYIGKSFQYLCTGFYWAKSSEKVIYVFEEMLNYMSHSHNMFRDDQIAANTILYNYREDHKDYNINVNTFDSLLFPNGYTYFHEQLLQKLNTYNRPFVVHANYILTQKLKRFHMQVHGLWLVKRTRKSALFNCGGGAILKFSCFI